MFERVTRRYGQPRFGLDATWVDGAAVPVIAAVAVREARSDPAVPVSMS